MEPIQRGIDRRRFLALSAAASGLAMGCGSAGDRQPESDAGTGMQYRPLGDTGLNVSVITFGSAGFENPALLEAALDAGINTISTGDNAAYGSKPQRSTDSVFRYPAETGHYQTADTGRYRQRPA
jgi:hypothetical protein